MANVKISQLTPKGANLAATDLLEISEFNGSGYETKSITGQQIIDAASGVAWGDITGTLSSQTDLNTALNGKQATLVSGTNIKTINGSSVLGSGDLTISGGGGIGGLQAFFPVSGNVLPASPYGGLFGSAMIADRVLIYPFVPSQNFTTSAVRINVTSAVAGANARILIYSNTTGSYKPNSKILETTNLDCSTTGEKSYLYSATFTKGEVYWIAVYSNSNPSVTHISAGNLFTLRQEQGSAMQEIEATYTFGTAPTTFPSVVSYNNRNCPNVGFVIA